MRPEPGFESDGGKHRPDSHSWIGSALGANRAEEEIGPDRQALGRGRQVHRFEEAGA
jgi:hypothetical protein